MGFELETFYFDNCGTSNPSDEEAVILLKQFGLSYNRGRKRNVLDDDYSLEDKRQLLEMAYQLQTNTAVRFPVVAVPFS